MKLLLIYQDKDRYNAIETKEFSSKEELDHFIDTDESFCPEGETTHYVIIEGKFKTTHGEVDNS